MKKLLLGMISVMAACSVYGQAVSYRNFNDTQFGSNNFKLSIKSGARGTNLFSASTFTSPKVYTDEIAATNSSELVIGAGGTTARIGAGTFRVDSPHTFSGSGANLTDIPPTTGILGWPANAAGVLANNGAGVLSWGAGGGGSGITVTNGSGTNLTLYTHDNVPDSTIAPALTIKPLEKPTVPGQGMTAMVIEPPYTNTGYRGRFTLRSTAATNTLGDLRPDITFNLGYNVDGADTNEPLWLDTRESRWQNIPSRSQLEIWHGFSPPINVHGTNDYFRYMGFNLVWDTTNRTYVSSDGNITIDSFYFGVPTVGTNAPGNGLAAFTFAKSRTNSMLLTANQQSQISFNGNTHPDGQAILDKDGGNLAGWYQYGMPAFGVPAAAESNAIVFLPGASLAGGANNTYRWLMGASNVFVGQQWNGPSNRWEYSKNSGGTTIGGLFYRPFNDFSAGWKSVYLSTSLSSTAGDYRELGYVTNHSGGNLSAMVVLTVVGYNNADIARYQVPLTTADGQSASWKECIPITRGLDTASPRIAVDVRGLDFTSALFRLRQLGSTTENNIRVTVELYGSSNGNGSPNGTDWVDTSANTGSGASVASYYRHTPMTQLLNRVGIGTNNPQAALHVIGQAMVSGSVATPKVYTDAIESTNSSSLLMTAGGSSLNLGSSALTLSGAAGGFSGVGANLTALNGTQITTGTIPPARFATNSASSNKWVRATSATTAEWTDLPASGGAVEYSNGQDVTATSGETATSFFYNGDDAMQLIHSAGTTGVVLGSEADSMLIQENGKDALYAANGLRHLKSAIGSTVSLDFSDPENPSFGQANPRTLDLANIGNGDFLVSVGGIIRGTNSLTVASVNVTGDFNVTGTIYPTNGFTHPNGVGKFFVPTNAPASNKIWRATSATTAEYADAPDVTQAGQNNLSGSNFVFNLNYTGKIRSLLDYGVDNTGATEMTGLIMAVSQTNKILYAPPGTYKIQYLLLTNQNAMIFGAGMNTKFVLAVPTNNAFAMTLSNQFVLKECWVQGGTNYDFKGGVGQATYGINMNVFGQGRLENVFVSEFQAGVTLGGTNRILDSFQNNDGKIIGGSISNCYIGLYATNLNAAEYATIDNLTIQDCSRAVQLNSAANIFYNGGKIVNNAIGIHCNPSTSGTDPLRAHSQFNGVNMNHSGTFVVGMASQNLSFRDCSMLGTGSLSLTQCTNYVFQGCQMQLSGTAILMSGGSNNMFLGNQFYADSSVTTSGILVGTNAYFDGNLKVGVGELFVNGTTALSADDQVIAARGYKTMTLSSDDGTAANRTFVINRGMPNQQLTIIWSGANQGQLLDDAACSDGAGNVRLSANWDAVAANQTLQLRSNGTDWFEVGRSAN